jgi:hypothetical protein
MKRDSTLNLRLPAAVKEALARAAARDMRSSSGMAVHILAEWLTAQGYLTNADAAPAKPSKRKGGGSHGKRL